MKLTARQVDSWVAAFDPHQNVNLILLYGTDAGGVCEHARTLMRRFLGDDAPPTQYTALNEDDVRGTPERLLDEAASVSIFGGTDTLRLVSLRGSGEPTRRAVKLVLATPPPRALIVVEAGMLAPSAALRKVVETADGAMAIPCFPLNATALARLVQNYFAKHQTKITADATAILVANLGEDRGVILRELERITLYLGIYQTTHVATRQIEAHDLEGILGDRSVARIDRLADAIAIGDLVLADRALSQLKQAGTPASASLSLIRRHFQMLYLAHGLCTSGKNSDAALTTAARPPLHFSRRPFAERALKIWSHSKIIHTLSLLHQAETDIRQSGAEMSETRTAYTLLRITRAARASAQ